jgi:hypothetical protein
MSHTLRLFNSVRDAAGAVVSGEIELTAGSRRSVSETIGASLSGTIALTIDVSALKAIFLVSDALVSLEFTGPDLAIQLAAGVPFQWFTGGGIDNPFGSTDVDSLLVENEVATPATVQIEILTDPTP